MRLRTRTYRECSLKDTAALIYNRRYYTDDVTEETVLIRRSTDGRDRRTAAIDIVLDDLGAFEC